MATIGERLRHARKTKKMTQVELAQRIGVAHSTIVRIERGQAKPTIETVEKLAEALGVQAKWLAFGDEPRRTKE